MKRAAPGPWQPGKGYVAFVAALVTSVLLSPLLVVGVVSVATVASSRALVEPVPGGSVVTGRVVSVENDCGRYGCSYQPTIRYTELTGAVDEFTAPNQDDDPAIGSAVRVSYDPRDPDEAHDISSTATYSYVTGLVMIGIVAVVVLGTTVGAVLIWRANHRVPATPATSAL